VENDGYIRGYTALVGHDRLGEGHIAFVQVKLSDTPLGDARSLQPRRAQRSRDRAIDRRSPQPGMDFRLRAKLY
jgi:DNA-binding Lrp family transcriptional regulator